MKTIAIASAKGGVGKSTITSALAVRACLESLKVALLDLNADQGNLTQWWMTRRQPMNPARHGHRKYPRGCESVGGRRL
jgi:cellulose biosynthesis protein BcsQ